MIKDPYIFKVFDLSTEHMAKGDSQVLEQLAFMELAPVYSLRDYGFLVYVGDIEENWPPGMMSKAFMAVLETTRELGCNYARFDRDGIAYPELETFEW